MMHSVLEEISIVRYGAPITVDYNNSNRYRLVVKESNGSKTAYYFSVPIYNKTTRKIINTKFKYNGEVICSTGSNANITVSNNAIIENEEGNCTIMLPQKGVFVSPQKVNCGSVVLFPTTNGVSLKCRIESNEGYAFIIDVDQPFLYVRSNDKCFALMKDSFTPFVVVSCIGSIDESCNVIAPAKIEYQKLTDKSYRIIVSTMSTLINNVLVEVNLYENKLFQDTTVESANPSINNVFGSVGFIGETSEYGKQWLYSRIDYSKLPEILGKRIQKAILHMPKFNQSCVGISAYTVPSRFCSFGSNWHNKIAGGRLISNSYSNGNYQSLDITSLIVEQQTKTIKRTEGLILKPTMGGDDFLVIATGDSCFAPQIMEVNFL